jgi:hypothetical protein
MAAFLAYAGKGSDFYRAITNLRYSGLRAAPF